MTQPNLIKVGSYVYSEADQIGKGSFGKVFKGKNITNGTVVAIKVIHIESTKQAQRIKMIKAEVEALKRSKSEYVIKFYDFVVQSSNVYIITEFCNQKDLRHYLNSRKLLNERKAVELLKQVVSAFKELCKQQVYHRDLKPANILLHNDCCKIADFGFAKTLDFSVTDYNTQMVSIVGTPLYMSPQLLDKQKYTTKSDIWSLGVIFFEMLFGKVPWAGKDPITYSKNIRSQPLVIDRTVNNISADAEDFIRSCLKVSEDERIGWNELFEHSLVCDEENIRSTKEDSTEGDDAKVVMPVSRIKDYMKSPVNPSTLIKSYQVKALEKSKDMTLSQAELTKTTLDQKIKHISQLALSQSLVPKGNGRSRGIVSSLYEDAKGFDTINQTHLKSNVLKDSKDLSLSPQSGRKGFGQKMTDETLEEFRKIESPLLVMKSKLNALHELYKAVFKKDDFKELQTLKFTFLLAVSKLINIIFKNLSGQVLTKKIKTRSHLLQDYLQSDGFKNLVVYVEMNKKSFDEMLKICSRKLFELNLPSDKDKDEVLDNYHEIYNEIEEQALLGKVIDMSNQMLYQIRFNSQMFKKSIKSRKSEGPESVSKEYFEGMLALFGDDTVFDNFKYDKLEDILLKVDRLKEEAKK